MDLGLNGKVALVTAGSKGIGKAVAEELATEGANVVICARGIEALEDAAAEMRTRGSAVLAVQTDVIQTDDVGRVVDETLQRFGRIDILINNAGEA